MLIRHLRRLSALFSKEKQPNPSKNQSALLNSNEYLLFPTKVPIFPYYVYVTKINKHLYDYISQNKIKEIVAFPLQPGVAKKFFVPSSRLHLETQLGLKPTATNSKSKEQESVEQNFQINNNNIIFDGPITSLNEPPVHYINYIDEIYPIGSICRLAVKIDNNQYIAHLRSQIRMKIRPQNYRNQESPIVYLAGKTLKNQNLLQIGSDHKTLLQLYNKMREITRINLPQVRHSSLVKSIELLSGYLCTLTYFTPMELYSLFQNLDLSARTKLLIQYYNNYLRVFEKQWKDADEGNSQKLDEDKQKQNVKEIYERMQHILGHKADVEYIKKIKNKLASGRYPENIIKLVECQLQNIQDLGDGNPQINRKKHYINLLVDYPFGISTKEDFDIEKARNILNQDHYGMKKVKQRILQFIAVSKIKGQFKSKVLLLYGPPGVGKTSVVKSIAKCLDRPYGRISLGGQYDTSIMKGHRKTYIGAYPGKIFDTIFKAKAQNPVILLDQIDKIQSRAGGASLQDVIMQVLDPIQNHKFKDDYVDIEIDLSKVLFICTANSLQTIFPPLMDRLQRIQVSGYTTDEKKQIFKQYIINQSLQNNGLPEELRKQIAFSENGLHNLIEGYCKEAGVRNLVRKTNKIFQKMALQYVRQEQFEKTIEEKQIKKYLGLPKFRQSRLFPSAPPAGVMIGLAYNSYGGSIMYIETSSTNLDSETKEKPENTENSQKKEENRGTLMVTGNIHDVMKESCQLAYSYARYIASTFFNNHYLQSNEIHLNFPQIQIGKDGPSAGVAITSTLLSLALNKPMQKQIGMTGEITLSGKVSAIGGVKEKTMGAKREGVYELIFPQDNRRDVEELEDQIKNEMTFHFAQNYFQVMDLIFGFKIQESEDN